MSRALWDRYREHCYLIPELGFSLDISRVRFGDDYLGRMTPSIILAIDAMEALEAGSTANRDEGRMVGHYWLRTPGLAPTKESRAAIRDGLSSIRAFADKVHKGLIQGTHGPFRHIIHVGIGGSALGAQLVCDALSSGGDSVTVHFLDNVDPDGVERVIQQLDGVLGQTLVSVVSKSGWTPTPWQVMLELEALFGSTGLDFARHAVATTMVGSELHARANRQRWIAYFPIWDWVGGRTSVTSAVGLLPVALQGLDTASFLQGAAAMDELTRSRSKKNPAALLALMWYWLGNGRGDKNMVVLPYKDRLAMFPRYVQQLVMESIGKKLDRNGRVVHQGLTVYGNKGATDQHAYVQQLRDGPDDFFVTFIQVGKDPEGSAHQLGSTLTLGDYLFGNQEGTRNALYEAGRDSITVAIPDVSPYSLGALIALYERTVGLYAELLNINAYHQPGVDKEAAADIVQLQLAAVSHLHDVGAPRTAEEIGSTIGRPDRVETIYKVLQRLSADGRGISALPTGARFGERFYSNRPVPTRGNGLDSAHGSLTNDDTATP